ncbi:MAG: S1-like domain-containing RNA-binding protein [Bacteroidetes bacterium]|nr:S1-like domain-containing RNA-binding protein [Bacteroidota bacterium]
MIEIGKYNELAVKSKAAIGLFLSDGNDDVLLPVKYVPEGTAVGDTLDVFVYLDNDNRPIATTLKPFATVDEFAFLTVKDVNEHGAFLDWGIAKDVFVSYAEQRMEMERGEKYLVFLFIDEFSGRIAATTKWSKFLDDDVTGLETGEEVQLLIAEKTDLGFKAIINNRYEGLLYQNEIFDEIKEGDVKRGYIKQVRDDGKIDLRLFREGYSHIEDTKLVILQYLESNKGVLALGDKSSPEEIYQQLKISKKAFKKTIGGLFRDRLITISDFEIKLTGFSEPRVKNQEPGAGNQDGGV